MGSEMCIRDRSGEFHDEIFYEPIDGALVREGLKLFCERNSLSLEKLNMRSFLAMGIWWNRQYEIVEEDEMIEETEVAEEELSEKSEEVILTAEDIADKIERHVMRAGRTYLRSKELTRVLNADIDFKMSNEERRYQLKIRRGHISTEATPDRIPKVQLWNELDINTYDRMSVLLMELGKIKTASGQVEIQPL